MATSDLSRISATKNSQETVCRQSVKLTSTARIDAPHEAPNATAQAATDGQAPAISMPNEADSDQLRLEADQLAAHLRSRQGELDHREAELNARTARLEADARAARLWIDQRQSDLIAAGEALARQQQELAARGQALAKDEQERAGRREELARRELELSDRQRELSRREQEVKSCLARLAAAEVVQQQTAASAAEKSEELQRVADRLQTQNAQLQQSAAELADGRQAVQRRADHVDQCRVALEQLRGELENMHRETLEIRLATEELWVQLSGAAPPAALVRSLGRIRAKLADQYRQAGAELAEQKKELQAIRGQLNTQHEKLIEHKLRLEQWALGRQEECDKQAARLAAREEELQREETWLREQSRRWQAERAGFQCELNRLRAKTAQHHRARETRQSTQAGAVHAPYDDSRSDVR